MKMSVTNYFVVLWWILHYFFIVWKIRIISFALQTLAINKLSEVYSTVNSSSILYILYSFVYLMKEYKKYFQTGDFSKTNNKMCIRKLNIIIQPKCEKLKMLEN